MNELERQARRLTGQASLSTVDSEQTLSFGITRQLSTIEAEPILWHWPGVIARGKVTLLAGDPGLGKSLITADITARTTRALPWPDGSGKPEAGSVIFASAEDDPADTIRPRLEVAGADVSKVHILATVPEVDEEGDIIERQFSLKRDIGLLADEVERLNDCRLLIIDPVTAYLGGTDSHKNAEVRELLAPLSDLASRTRVAVLAVSHLNKGQGGNALYRVSGSLAFVAAARASWIVCKDQDDEARRLVLPAKNNLAPDDSGGFAYRVAAIQTELGEVPRIEWERDRVDVTAFEAMQSDEDRTAKEEAEDFLITCLNDGQTEAAQILKQARANGISERTLKRAKAALGIRSTKDGFSGKWRWQLGQEDQACPRPKLAPLAPFAQVRGFRPELKDANTPTLGTLENPLKPQQQAQGGQECQILTGEPLDTFGTLAACRQACQGLSVKPEELHAWLSKEGDPEQFHPDRLKFWANHIEQRGYPNE